MKKELSSIELKFVLSEIQDLSNSKVDKIFQTSKKEVLIVLHVTGKGKKMLRLKVPNYLCLTDYKGEMPERPPAFCSVLRKQIGNSILRSIRQVGFERIVELVFETREKRYILFVELFSKGNIILCDESLKILSVLESQIWKTRTLRKGEIYHPPLKLDINTLSFEKFEEIIKKSEHNISKTLATRLSLGGMYAEELCLMAGIEKDKERLTETEMKNLFKSLLKLLNKKISPRAIFLNGDIIELIPFEMEFYKGYEEIPYENYNLAIDTLFSKLIKEAEEKKRYFAHNKKIIKLERAVEQQKKSIEKLSLSAKENQAKGEFIYHNYKLVQEIIDILRKARKKHNWQEIKEKLKDHKTIKNVDVKSGKVTIEI